MLKILDKFYKSKFAGLFLHTFYYSIQKELEDCESVLDLGCGYTSPIQYCKNIKYSVGVEAFAPYLEKAKETKLHTEYVGKKIEEVDFPGKSFDAVMMIEVLEHLPEETGYEILKKAEKWARKKIIVTSPNGFFPQSETDGNNLQIHLSGWDYGKMKKLGFKCHGSGGLKFFRNKLQAESHAGFGGKLAEFLWKTASILSQAVVFFYPKEAFSLLSIKIIK